MNTGKNSAGGIRIVSCDLNGTLVHQHTMADMIRLYFPHEPERYRRAKAAFDRQTNGDMSMGEAFGTAGPLTRGLTLGNALEYAVSEMCYVNGFDAFLHELLARRCRFVINSTGYDVTLHAMRARFGRNTIHDMVCNRLLFVHRHDPTRVVETPELISLVDDYVIEHRRGAVYEDIIASGEIILGLRDESEKTRKLFEIVDMLNCPSHGVAHVGDTMGDAMAVWETAQRGGVGIAFNYNPALQSFLEDRLSGESVTGRIHLVHPKSEISDLTALFPILQ